MGQGQSADGSTSSPEAPLKQDYYELLGVERTATEDEIKKAYRRRALELHPDRNYGNVEEATKLFAEIQSAYEILADPQERAWYDSHRDVLLRGDSATNGAGEEYSYNIRMTTADEVVKLMLKFKKVEYTDGPAGFFGGLNDFFSKLAKEEDVACQWQDIDFLDYPEFGLKDDEYEDIVRPFYGAWSGFATKKSYSWKDQYRLSDAPDRRIRRLMEKENQKLRDEAIQEFNDAVRSLVAFVRKRDPRIQNNQKSEAERQKILREAAAAQAARSRAQRQKELEKNAGDGISAWAQSRNKDEHEGGFSSESDSEEHEYDCVVCDKTFKSEAQFHTHEKSKKHLKLLKDLKREMRREGKDLDLQPQPRVELEQDTDDQGDDTGRNDDQTKLCDEDKSDANGDVRNDSQGKPGRNGHLSAEHEQTEDRVNLEGDDTYSHSESDDDYASRATAVDRITKNEEESLSTRATSLTLEETPGTSEFESGSQPKLGKAKQKRAKRANQKEQQNIVSSDFDCVVCKASFASKNKLFDHIATEGHAAPISQIKNSNHAAGKGGKKKRK